MRQQIALAGGPLWLLWGGLLLRLCGVVLKNAARELVVVVVVVVALGSGETLNGFCYVPFPLRTLLL